MSNRIRLDNDEKIVCEYLCAIRFLTILRFVCLTAFAFGLYFTFLEQNLFVRFCVLIVGLGLVMALYEDAVCFYHHGLYVTNKNLITFRGKKVPLDDVWFSYRPGGGESNGDIVFYNKKKFFMKCYCYDDYEDFDNFLLSIYKVSGNEFVLYFGSDKINRGITERKIYTFMKLIEKSIG